MDNGPVDMVVDENPNDSSLVPVPLNNGLEMPNHVPDENEEQSEEQFTLKPDLLLDESPSSLVPATGDKPAEANAPMMGARDLTAPSETVPREPKENVLPVKELSSKALNTLRVNCPECQESYALAHYFVHITEAHDLYACLYCYDVFKFSKELMVHLHREHRVPPQKFSNGKDFMSCGGENTTLLCVECNCIFELTRDLDPNAFGNHECKKTVGICSKCGANVPSKALREHTRICQGSMNMNLNGTTNMTTTQLRNRDNACKNCKKKFSPSKILAHTRSCTGSGRKGLPVHSPLKLPSPTNVELDMKSLTLPPSSQPFFTSPPQNSSPPKSPSPQKSLSPQKKTPEAPLPRLLPIVAKPEVKLHPLLLESDADKRLEMLVLLLVDHVMKRREQAEMEDGVDGSDKYRLVLVGDLDQVSEDKALNQMIDATSPDCDYCRQVKLIRIDKRQLVIHLLTMHDWDLGSVTIQPDPVTLQSEPVTLQPAEPVPELKTELQDVRVTPVEDTPAPSPDSEVKVLPTESEHCSTSGSDAPESRVALLPTPLSRQVFFPILLRKVFQSSSLVFTYEAGEGPGFGRLPCECLICGYADTQNNLFPHWRKIHRGMAMECVMCHGKFLFAGALFSHVCLGTPQHFLTTASGGKVGTGTVKPNGMEGPIEGETANDTIVLRYQCGICENLQLPGFFNYMVHLRQEHHQCELCLEAVANQAQLEQHMKKHKLNHFCWKCSVTYCAKPNFMTHLFWKHGTESLDCSACLKKKWPHIYHFCTPPKWFTCDVCGLFFTRPKSLVVHKRLHTRNDLKECEDCEENFISNSLLRKHVAVAHREQLKVAEFKSDSEDSDEGGEEEKAVPMDTEVKPEVAEVKEEEKMELDESLELQPEPKSGLSPPHTQDEQDSLKGSLDQSLEKSLEDEVGRSDAGALSSALVTESAGMDESAPSSTISTEEASTPTPDTDSAPVTSTTEEPGPSSPDKQLTISVKEDEPVVSTTLDSKKMKKSKKAKKERFRLDSVLGPNLSEDESSSDEEMPCEKPAQTNLSLSESESESDTEAFLDTLESLRKAEELKKAEEAAKDSEIMKPPPAPPIKLLPPPPPSHELPMIPSSVSGECEMRIGPPPGSVTPRLDLSSTATLSLFDDGGPLSPLLHPLDEFNLSVPEIPTFEENSLPDHISHENALQSIQFEHDYCLPAHAPKSIKRLGGIRMFGSIPPPAPPDYLQDKTGGTKKELKVRRPVLKTGDSKETSKKRRRHESSSSSSSSSSCSSCGSNCSCSSSSSGSSSSSDSSSSDSDSDTPTKSSKDQRKVQPLVMPRKRAIKPKVKAPPKPKKLKPVKDPNIPKRPKGRPPKGSKKLKFMGEYEQPNRENGLGWREAEILKHFKRPEDAFIPEEDLDTEDSGAEEVFRRQQLQEPINPTPPLIDEPWTAGNEKFLLKFLLGVKNLEELRPKAPSPPLLPPEPEVVQEQYSVKPSENGESRLKVRNVPIKPLIVRRTVGNSDNYTQSSARMTIGNTTLIGKGPLKTSLSSGTNSTTITISRGLPTAATALPASGLVKSRRKLPVQPPVVVPPSHPNINGESWTPSAALLTQLSHLPSAAELAVVLEPSVPDPKSESESTATPPVPGPVEPVPVGPKPRRARMKVTEIKPKKVTPVVVVEETDPDVKLYCICQGPHDNVSQMIGCDAKECPYQWFHFECVGIMVAPKGKWFCQECRDKRRKKAVKQKEMRESAEGSSSGRGRSSMTNALIGHTLS